MNLHRTTLYIIGLFAAAVVAMPSTALASSLLSGYGGPGQGNQAVLGSALVNGPKSGGGGGRSGGSAGAKAAEGEIEGTGYRDVPSEEPSSEAPHGGGSAADRSAGTGGGSSKAARRAAGARRESTASKPAAAQLQSFYPAAEHVPAGAQGVALGLSGTEVVYVLLAFAVLVLLGFLTRRVASDPQESARG
jgi:hypothetical protein